jgi:hypothetical protein
MKIISPVQSWVNGKSVTATIFNLYPVIGTLFVQAGFCYQLLDENQTVVAQGNIYMTGEAYQAWGNDDEYAYNWAASPEVLNLTIVGDYVPPVLSTTEETV